MSVSIYPSQQHQETEIDGKIVDVFEPVLDFAHHQKFVLKDLPDEQLEREKNPFERNPHFVSGAGISMSGINLQRILAPLRLDGLSKVDIDLFEQMLVSRSPRALEGARSLEDLVYIAQRINDFAMMVSTGRKHGATHIVFA